MNTILTQIVTALQIRQFDQKCQPGDFPTQFFDQPRRVGRAHADVQKTETGHLLKKHSHTPSPPPNQRLVVFDSGLIGL